MGTYCYTLRKKQVTLRVNSGGVWSSVKANICSYAYKLSWGDSSEYKRLTSRAESNAERAFESYTGGYVIDGNIEDGLDNCPVYVKVSKASYLDSYDFPGEIVGFIEVRDGRNYLVPHTAWTTCTRIKDNTQFQIRMIIRDGKAAHEDREIGNPNPLVLS